MASSVYLHLSDWTVKSPSRFMQLLMVEIKQWSLAGFIFGFGWFFVFVCLCVCSGLVRTFPSLGREKQHIQLVCVGRYTYGIVLTSRYQQKEKKLKEGIGILGSFFFVFFLFEKFCSKTSEAIRGNSHSEIRIPFHRAS